MSVTNTSHYYSPDPSHAWCRSGRAAVCAGPLEPGEWMDTLVSSLLRSAPLLLNARAPAQEPATGHWRIETGKTSPTFHYLPVPAHYVYSVLFPTPEHRIGLRLLAYWLQRRAREFWFCELDGWRRVSAPAWVGRRLALAGLRRCPPLAKISGLINYLPTSERQFRFQRDRTSATRWHEGIEADNRALGSFWPAFPGRRPRVALYAGLPPLPPTDRLAAVADELAGHGLCVRLLAHGGESAVGARQTQQRAAGWTTIRRSTGQDLTGQAVAEVDWDLLWAIPASLREETFRLTAELVLDWPDVLHCGDHANGLVTIMAGFLAGVPTIVVHPEGGTGTDVALWRMLACSRRVHFLTDGHGEAGRLGKHLSIPADRLHIAPPPHQVGSFLSSLYRRLLAKDWAVRRTAA